MVDPILNTNFPSKINSVNTNESFAPRGVGVPKSDGKSFSNLIKDITNEGIEAGNNTELQGSKSLNKSTDIVDVVTAVTNAEVTLETAVAIRDRIISAYQTIMRMPI